MHVDFHPVLRSSVAKLFKKRKPACILERLVFCRCVGEQFAANTRQNHFPDQRGFVAIAPAGGPGCFPDPSVWPGMGGQIVHSTNFILLGAIAMATVTAGVFFLRFWHMTKDRFFLFFAASFLIDGINRFVLGLLNDPGDDSAVYYLIRVLSYGLIIFAIVDKNLPRKNKDKE
jgi:hypothetical protein